MITGIIIAAAVAWLLIGALAWARFCYLAVTNSPPPPDKVPAWAVYVLFGVVLLMLIVAWPLFYILGLITRVSRGRR